MSENQNSGGTGSEGDAPEEVLEQPTIPVDVRAKQEAAKESASASPDDKIAALEKEKKETYERLLRTAADFDNFRKRARKDVDDARHKAREDVLKEMLPVIDNLERALAATAKDATNATAVVDGVKLVLRQFQSALERFEVKGFSSVGEPFDPSRHEAISQLETAAQPAGSVAAEMQKGYMMGSRLLRPALVAVAKAPAAPAEPTEPSPEHKG